MHSKAIAALSWVLTACALTAPVRAGDDLEARERALQDQLTALRSEIQRVEEELTVVRKERAVNQLEGAVISFYSIGLCLYDEFPQGHTRCKQGPSGTYRILEYIHAMRLSKVLTPDDRVAFGLVGLIDLPNGPVSDKFRLLIEREASRYEAQQDAKAAEAERAALAQAQEEEEERTARRRAAAEKRAADLRKKYAGSPYADTIVARKVSLGMTADMVRDAWGAPDDINRTILSDLTKEQWVYGSKSYVYFECQAESCLVTAIQN